MATNSTSFNNTPQATDDSKTLFESELFLGSIINLDVLSNDLGGNAKKLWSVNADAETWEALKNSDKVGVFEYGANGNGVRINLDSTISYQLNSVGAGRTIDSLAQGETFTDTVFYTIRLANGTLSKAEVTITIVGENDRPVVQNVTVAVLEDAIQAGQLTATDVDAGDAAAGFTFTAVGDVPAGFTLSSTGAYSIDATNAAYQHLAAGATEIVTVSYTATDINGGVSDVKTITITITGVNDDASITGTKTGSLTEDAIAAATGTLTVSDVDDGEDFAKAASGTSAKGSYTVDTNGNWSYTVNNAAAQHLAAGATDTDTFTVTSQDGTASETVTITITGVNDDASITGTTTGSVTEDGATLTAGGTLTASDVDDGQAKFQTVTATALQGVYGSFTFNENTGVWGYTLNNTAANVQALGATDQVTDQLVVTSFDGTDSETITVTINGAADGAAPAPAVVNAADVNDKDTEGAGVNNQNIRTDAQNITGSSAGLIHYGSNYADIIDGKSGGDAIYGFGGNDTLYGGQGVDTIYGGEGADFIEGNTQTDVIYGGSGNDTIAGNQDDDLIYGGSGNDTINGNGGLDTIIGGHGADTLSGGGDDGAKDTFRFLSTSDTGDTIEDFQSTAAVGANHDVIDLDALGLTNSLTNGTTLTSHGTIWFYNEGTDETIVQADTDGVIGTAEFQIQLTGNVTLQASDFVF